MSSLVAYVVDTIIPPRDTTKSSEEEMQCMMCMDSFDAHSTVLRKHVCCNYYTCVDCMTEWYKKHSRICEKTYTFGCYICKKEHNIVLPQEYLPQQSQSDESNVSNESNVSAASNESNVSAASNESRTGNASRRSNASRRNNTSRINRAESSLLEQMMHASILSNLPGRSLLEQMMLRSMLDTSSSTSLPDQIMVMRVLGNTHDVPASLYRDPFRNFFGP